MRMEVIYSVEFDLRKNDTEEGCQSGGLGVQSRMATPEDTTMLL